MLARGRTPTAYNLGEQRAFEERIDADPLDSNTHAVYGDWLEERGMPEEAAFRRDLAAWLSGPFKPSPPHELLTGGRWELTTGFGGSYPRSLDPAKIPAGRFLPRDENTHVGMRHPRDRVSWATWRDMENALRDAWRAGRQANNARGGSPARYSNTYIPTREDADPIGYVRASDKLEGERWLQPLVREVEKLSKQDLDGIKVDVNTLTKDVRVDVMDWGDPKVGKKLVDAAKKLSGVGHVEEVNEAGKPFGRGWVSLYSGARAPTNYSGLGRFLGDPNRKWKFGDCGIEAARIAQAALRAGYRNFRVVDGHVIAGGELLPHTWLTENGRVVDPTAGQFGGAEVVYAPEGEYLDEFSPEAYLQQFRDNFGEGPPETYAGGRAPTAYAAPYEFCSTQVDLVGEPQMRVLQAGREVPDAALADKGRETDAHVTVRWGLHGDDPGAVAELVKGVGPIDLRLGRASVFEGEKYDVLKFEVESAALRRINRLLGALPNTQTHPTYRPHATVAYLKPGLGKVYAARLEPLNLDVRCDGFVFCDRQGRKTWVSTTGRPPREVEVTPYGRNIPAMKRAQHAFVERRAQRPPEELARLIRNYLVKKGPTVQNTLSKNVNLSRVADFMRGAQHGLDSGWLKVTTRSGKPDGGGRPGKYWEVGEVDPDSPPQQLSRYAAAPDEELVGGQTDEGGRDADAPDPPILPQLSPTSPRNSPAEGAPQDQSGRPLEPATSGAVVSEPEAEPARPPRPLDLDYADPQRFAESVGVALGYHGRDDADTLARAEAGMAVAARLPRLVYERISERLTGVVSHPDTSSVGAAWREATGTDPNDPDFGLPEGFYDPATGVAAVNGADPAGVFAHEMGHAIDTSRVGGGYPQLSTADEWKSAYRRELASGDLSDYATIDPHEGFAEFCRLVYAHPDGQEVAARQFPRCFAFFASYGLV